MKYRLRGVGRMGQGRSKERYQNAVKKLSSLELANIEAVFNEISTEREDGTRHVELSLVNRQDFAERLRLPGFIAERLFHAFDRSESGTIDLEEFIGGIALCLHGTVKDKCRLLFHIFNLAEDGGVSKDELTAVLLSSLESAQTILDNVEDDPQASKLGAEADKLIETVTRMVADAFETCHVSKTGKLSAKEFENWLYRNPKIMDNVFGWQCPSPEEGHWMNESSPEPSPTPTPGFGKPDDSVRSVEVQGVPTEQTESRTLSDLFSSSSTTGHDKEGQSFFDSLVVPNDGDSFRQLIHQSPHFSREFLPSTEQTFQQPAQPLYESSSQLLMENARQSLRIEPQQFFEKEPQSPRESVEPEQQPPQNPVPLAEVLKDPLQVDQIQKPAVDPLLEMDLSKEPRQPSATPTPEGEWVRSKQTEAERRRSAWICPPQTKQFLVTIGSGMLNPLDVDQQFLTAPGLVIEESLIDPVKDFLNKFGGEQEAEKRKTLTVDSVPLDESGLRELLAAQCWRVALEFTTKFLTAHGQGLGQKGQRALHTHKTLQVWLCRIALLFKLRMFSTAEVELEAFGNFNQPDLFYEFYPDTYPGRKGSMVPFALRVLHAELPQYLGRHIDSLDNLYYLQRTCRQVLKNLQDNLTEEGGNTEMTPDERNAAIELWISRDVRILYSIGNCLLSMRDYSLAITVFESIIERDPSCTLSLLSGIGRIYLQLGDLESAQSRFKQVESKAMGDAKSLCNVVINKGMLALSRGLFEEAHRHFLAATKLDPNNTTAVNNVAASLVYLGKLTEARSVMEMLIWKDPKTNLYEVLLYNLCTIYDLESSQGLQKKIKLFEHVAEHRGYGFDISYFKIA